MNNFRVFFLLLLPSALAAAELVLPAKFDFRAAPAAPGVRQVLPTTLFSSETGYGFKPGV